MQIYSTYRDSILQYKIYTCGFISYLVVSGLSVCGFIICGFNFGALNRVALLRVALVMYIAPQITFVKRFESYSDAQNACVDMKNVQFYFKKGWTCIVLWKQRLTVNGKQSLTIITK